MIRWFVKNHVAANLLMLAILFMGYYSLRYRIPLEVFPDFELDIITIDVRLRGASPAEIEESVIIHIEEAIYDLEGIKEIKTTSSENGGRATIEIDSSYHARDILNDIKNRVDAINTFPSDIERPLINIAQRKRQVISVIVSGQKSQQELKWIGESIRDNMAQSLGSQMLELGLVRPYEISIEVVPDALKKYNLSISDISQAIRASSLQRSAGSLKTQGGEILLRTQEQAYYKSDYENIPILSGNSGERLFLKDIATIVDGFEEEPLAAEFNGNPCVVIDIYRTGQQSAIELANQVKDFIIQKQASLPDGITLDYWRDRSRIVKSRLETLLRSAFQGGILVFIVLTLFLRPILAFWVCVGIPVTFMGALILMPYFGITINILSLFAFILVLGIVVDDAIVTGENIFSRLKRGDPSLKAAIEGTEEVAVPVTFGILTTIVAFIPLALIEGRRGVIFNSLPYIVIPVLLFSLIESKLILPTHLKNISIATSQNLWSKIQNSFSEGLEFFVQKIYQPFLNIILQHRYLTLCIFISFMMVLVSLVGSGHLRFIFFPRVPHEIIRGTLTMPTGTPFEITTKHLRHMQQSLNQIKEKYRDPNTEQSVIQNTLVTIGATGTGRTPQSHIGQVTFELVSPEKRTIQVHSLQIAKEWRKSIGNIPGAKELNFRAEIARGSDPINIQLSGQDFSLMSTMSQKIKQKLSEYPEVFDISDSLDEGKDELQIHLKAKAKHLNITTEQLSKQIRQAFFGEEAQRIQRGRDDIRIMVRYTKSERDSVQSLEQLSIQNSQGAMIPISELADIKWTKSPSSIERLNRNRTLQITADYDKKTANFSAIKNDLIPYLDQLISENPSIRYSLEGEAKEQREAFGSLLTGLIFLFFCIYALLAIPFKSYFQPFIVMSVIPFGLLGALLGHLIMGMDLSLFSIFGMLALTGVVVNDSLVLVDFVNRQKKMKQTPIEAACLGGAKRFRPILLTSLTTFAGLMPLIYEKSTQAQFLIPMAVSLGFGILFATFITLLLVPINYVILEDIKQLFRPKMTKP